MAPDLIIYGVVAAGLVLWLRSLLGTRHGEERDRTNPLVRATLEEKENVFGDKQNMSGEASRAKAVEEFTDNPPPRIHIANKTVTDNLVKIAKADKNFDLKFFTQAVQDSYAIVIEAFAEGDKQTLRDMLGEKVYKAFEAAINARDKKGETQFSEIQSISKTELREATLTGKEASIAVYFKADQITYTKDKDGKIISGDEYHTEQMADIWVFTTNIKSPDPRWLITETRGGFEDDNDMLPNTDGTEKPKSKVKAKTKPKTTTKKTAKKPQKT